jgi:hypothetical protein
MHAVCFRAGTLVSTEHGWKAIESIAAGERVHCVPEDNVSAPVDLRVVLQAFHNAPQPLLLVVAEDLRVWATFNHPIFAEGQGWTPAGKLSVGDLLRTREGHPLLVTDIVETGIIEPVYNLQVAGHHTYFVGSGVGGASVLVHNDSYSPDTKAFWKGADITAKAVGLPPYLITWNRNNSTTITAQPGATPGFNTSTALLGFGWKSAWINFPADNVPRRLDRIGKSGWNAPVFS